MKYAEARALNDKRKYGKDSKSVALVTGSLKNCSTYLLVLADCIVVIKTARVVEL